MIDYQLVGGDFVISGGDFVMVTGNEATAQRLSQKFLLWRGEWFLDQDAGVPWLQDILGRRPRPEVLQALIRDVVQNDPGVAAVLSLDIELLPERHLRISFRARAVDGEILTMEVDL